MTEIEIGIIIGPMRFLPVLAVFLALSVFAPGAQASHSWGGFHWARTSNPFVLKLGDNLTSNWDPYLATTSADWSQSNVLDTNIVVGNTSARRCRPVSGGIEVCNYRYGNNGWLGVAQVWISGSHITQAITKLNDTYFGTAQYNTPAWKNLVMCQEVGHTFGLDHQDENFDNTNLGSCMDYTSNPESNQHPNNHDYEQLASIYSHLDTFNSIQNSTQKLPFGLSISQAIKEADYEHKNVWGKELRNNGKVALYERDFGFGNKLYTFTIWAQE